MVQTGVQPQGTNHRPLDPGSYCHPGPTLQGHNGGQATDARGKRVSEGAGTGGGEEPSPSPAPERVWALPPSPSSPVGRLGGGPPRVTGIWDTGPGRAGGLGGRAQASGSQITAQGEGRRHKSSREELVNASVNSGKVDPSSVKLNLRVVGWWCARLQRGAFAPLKRPRGTGQRDGAKPVLKMSLKAFEAARREAAVEQETGGIAPRASGASLGAAAPWGARRGAGLL